MKLLINLITVILITFQCPASTEQLLVDNGLSKLELENKGLKILRGELTGAGRTTPIRDLEMIATKKRLIHKVEIEEFNLFIHPGETLGNLESVNVNGENIINEEIQAFIVKKAKKSKAIK